MEKYMKSLNSNERRQGTFYALTLLQQPSILALGVTKSIATPDNNTIKLIDDWNKLDSKVQDFAKYRFLTNEKNYNNVELGVYIHPNLNIMNGNPIIFYSVNDLNKLACISNKTTSELLEIFSNACPINNNFHMDLIKIAFGNDLYTLETDKGKQILYKYNN